jgi:hypothetical protein
MIGQASQGTRAQTAGGEASALRQAEAERNGGHGVFQSDASDARASLAYTPGQGCVLGGRLGAIAAAIPVASNRATPPMRISIIEL